MDPNSPTVIDEILKWAAALSPIVIFWGIWRLRNRDNVRDAEERGSWRGKRESFEVTTGSAIESINKAIAEIRKDIRNIYSILRIKDPVASSGSPIRLTELGEKIAEEIRARERASTIADSLKSEVRQMDAYQIQEFCLEHIRNTEFDLRLEADMRKSAFDNGVDVLAVKRVLAIVLRDQLIDRLGD